MRRLFACLSVTLLSAIVFAHEKWFVESDPYPLRWDLFLRPLPLGFAIGVVVLTAVFALLWKKRGRNVLPGPETLGATDDRRAAVYGLVPLILGVHVAVPMLVNGVNGHLFSPDNELPGGWKYILGVAQTGIALALFYGALTRIFAVAMGLLWVMGLLVIGVEPMLDNILYLGLAVFFFLAGRGPISIDRLLFPKLEPSEKFMEHSLTAARIGLGLSLVIVAFTEKLANMPLATDFLKAYPLNFTSYFGLPMSNELFVLCAGAVELVAGLWILFGIFPREIVLVAWLPINMTLTIFNWVELIGHLPIYGIMAALVIWSPGKENLRLWVYGLRGGPLGLEQAGKC